MVFFIGSMRNSTSALPAPTAPDTRPANVSLFATMKSPSHSTAWDIQPAIFSITLPKTSNTGWSFCMTLRRAFINPSFSFILSTSGRTTESMMPNIATAGFFARASNPPFTPSSPPDVNFRPFAKVSVSSPSERQLA